LASGSKSLAKNIKIKKKTQVEVSVYSETIILDIRQLVFERIRLRTLLLWYFLPTSSPPTHSNSRNWPIKQILSELLAYKIF
jgi:hypothetical protein